MTTHRLQAVDDFGHGASSVLYTQVGVRFGDRTIPWSEVKLSVPKESEAGQGGGGSRFWRAVRWTTMASGVGLAVGVNEAGGLALASPAVGYYVVRTGKFVLGRPVGALYRVVTRANKRSQIEKVPVLSDGSGVIRFSNGKGHEVDVTVPAEDADRINALLKAAR